MKKIFIIYIILSFTACSEKKEGVRIDLSKNNDIVTVSYTNLSDTIYVLNGIMCRPVHENEKILDDGEHTSTDINEAAPMPYFDEKNQPPYIKNITYEKDKNELTLQKIRDSISNRPTHEENIPLESVLILYPKTTRTVKLKLDRNSNKHYLQMFDYYNMGRSGKFMFGYISPVLKDVNPNYYLYKYRFNSRSKLKINLK